MNTFEYISVLISVLLGLAMTHLVIGTVSIIQDRETIKVYWVHLLWVVNTAIYITTWWWAFHYWDGLVSWEQSTFYLLFGYSLLLTAIAGLLFPVRGVVTDYRTYFYKHFRWFFALQFLWFCLDIVEVNLKDSLGLRPIPGDYYLLTIPMMLCLFAAIFVRNAKYHAFLAPLLFAWQAIYAIVIFVAID